MTQPVKESCHVSDSGQLLTDTVLCDPTIYYICSKDQSHQTWQWVQSLWAQVLPVEGSKSHIPLDQRSSLAGCWSPLETYSLLHQSAVHNHPLTPRVNCVSSCPLPSWSCLPVPFSPSLLPSCISLLFPLSPLSFQSYSVQTGLQHPHISYSKHRLPLTTPNPMTWVEE